MACDASFLKHDHTPVIHFGLLHFKNEETLFYSAGPISRYSRRILNFWEEDAIHQLSFHRRNLQIFVSF